MRAGSSLVNCSTCFWNLLRVCLTIFMFHIPTPSSDILERENGNGDELMNFYDNSIESVRYNRKLKKKCYSRLTFYSVWLRLEGPLWIPNVERYKLYPCASTLEQWRFEEWRDDGG